MATASGGVLGAPASITTPYVVTNVTGQPGDVGIFLPGTSSEMLAVFNVGSVGAPAGAMTTSSYIFGSLDAQTYTALNGARGAYVNPSNFAGQASTIFDKNGNNIPISLRNGQVLGSLPGGSANQLMVTADSVGANTPVVPDLDLHGSGRHGPALRLPIDASGVSGALSTAQTTPAPVNSRSRIRALSCSGSRASRRRLEPFPRPARPLTSATQSPVSPPARRPQARPVISPPARFRTRSISEPTWAPSRSTAWTEATMAARSH